MWPPSSRKEKRTSPASKGLFLYLDVELAVDPFDPHREIRFLRFEIDPHLVGAVVFDFHRVPDGWSCSLEVDISTRVGDRDRASGRRNRLCPG